LTKTEFDKNCIKIKYHQSLRKYYIQRRIKESCIRHILLKDTRTFAHFCMHNVTMQIADGSGQKYLLPRFAVGAAPEAADFNYESSATDGLVRAPAHLLSWPVAHSKFGSYRWALPGNETFAAHHKLLLASSCKNPSASNRPLTSLFFLSVQSSLSPSIHPTVTFSLFFSPCTSESASSTRTFWHFVAAIPYAIISFRCYKICDEKKGLNSRFLYTTT